MNVWARVRHELVAIVVLTALLLAMAMLATPVASAASTPQVQSNGSVDYVSGGIGKDEADALRRQSVDYPLTLEFASARGTTASGDAAYVADVDVNIADAGGRQVLTTHSGGPLLLVRLPPGEYTVVAEWNGVRKEHHVDIPQGGGRRHVVLTW